MYLKLIRERADGKAVRGTLYQVHFLEIGYGHHNEQLTKICDTLENADYLIPALIYRVDVTMSPRFQRPLPLVCNVPYVGSGPLTPPPMQGVGGSRPGIRIHRGTRPEHSKGCVLVPGAEIESYVTDMLLACKQQGEEVRLEIV